MRDGPLRVQPAAGLGSAPGRHLQGHLEAGQLEPDAGVRLGPDGSERRPEPPAGEPDGGPEAEGLHDRLHEPAVQALRQLLLQAAVRQRPQVQLPDRRGHHHARFPCRLESRRTSLSRNPLPATSCLCSSDSLPRPTITPPRLEVEEGSPVRLECSAVNSCPVLPPAVTWTPVVSGAEETAEAEAVTSVMNFTASHLHDGLTVSCAAVYVRLSGSGDLVYERSLTLRVFCEFTFFVRLRFVIIVLSVSPYLTPFDLSLTSEDFLTALLLVINCVS